MLHCMHSQDAARLAQKVVSNYGMSDLGITVHAPPAGGSGFMRKSFEARTQTLFAVAHDMQCTHVVHTEVSLA